jgi:hypothetical protein
MKQNRDLSVTCVSMPFRFIVVNGFAESGARYAACLFQVGDGVVACHLGRR